ncbi:right-handed parallel beta-helix repeat-containing protein [Paenibacillus psychroresistens]|uniref:Right-handed parallel beta-helix repeat-containing protein n=1 Tax=Paenibacillus psychroresistens TaxID=1778678 RepID=A0A6B8RI85_9BACL|nr:right-handed parallel beta-helix repeat-containing protein [Paenibacillus psychroresistens]QGQ95096.1 right-handed parallel beta-helix repeat-containing protein [Paenibacillus psychroresistens]
MTLWRTDVPDLVNTRHLYVNGSLAPRSRTSVKETSAWEIAQNDEMPFWKHLETYTTFQGEKQVYAGYLNKDNLMASWSNPQDIEFVYNVGWTHVICPVEGIEQLTDGTAVRMKMPCFRDCQIKGGVQVGAPSYVENVFELLDKQGEWYFNRLTRTLYYVSLMEENPNDMDIVVPYVEQLLVIKGTPEQPVSGLSFHNIDFNYTTWLRPGEQGHAEVQASLIKDPNNDENLHSSFIKPSAAILLNAVQDVIFTGCSFRHLGSGGIDIENGSCNIQVIGNVFSDIAGSGVQVGGFTEHDAHPTDLRLIVKDNVVRNNYFYDIGTEYKGSVAVLAGYTEGTVIEHNEICRVAYSGISVGWGWGYFDPDSDKRWSNLPPANYNRYEKPTVARRNRIAFNHIHQVMQKLHDGAGIYTLSLQPDSAIIGNYVHDNGHVGEVRYRDAVMNHHSCFPEDGEKHKTYLQAPGFPGGIYLDEGSGGFEVAFNVTHGVAIPIFYHNVMRDRFYTNHFHDNHYDNLPGDSKFMSDIVSKAGLESEYRYLLEK